MSVFIDISAALDGRLNTMASLPPVAWENVEYAPVVGTLYLRPTLLMGDSTQASLGDSGEDENIGVYQVDVFAEAGTGKNAAIVMADNIANHFKRGTDMVYNGRTVRVQSASRGPASTSDGWYQMPVNITFYSITDART